ncbi:ParB-like nuclease domain-containing protein [Aquamicrobium aerolatum DSM 21857]|uniref:ParB-like nuclease domain-containing protein n=1 Tax=Aquamicrobium aerolatum DSM 21857 TaxID=1121003 RepID=A0A1I3S624_9HYPH|nr:ParB-like nuclease domain-containing protein [Aquamicrobium aerolatum DSM 21857]
MGILNPITVYPRKVIVDHIAVDGYGIVAGLHRFTACKELGIDEIPANVVSLSELERQIAECDENLCGPKLTPAEKSLFTRRRKEAYEALHPETRHGGDRKSDQVDKLSTRSYADDQASKTGVDARTVRRDAERGEKIAEDLLEMITDTHLDSGACQDRINAGSRLPRPRS